MALSAGLRRPLTLSCLVLRSLAQPSGAAPARSLSSSPCLLGGHWDKDFKPGPYPKTEEERRKAAEKYNLPYGMYEPYPCEDGLGRGDYPKLPNISGDARDPYYPWDYPEVRRNFNETISTDEMINNRNRYDTNYVPRYTRAQMFAGFFGVVGLISGAVYYMEDYKMFRPVLAKQYPHEGPHYLFPGDSHPGSSSHH